MAGSLTLTRTLVGEVVIEEIEERAGGVTAYYTGETAFSLSVRGGEHLKALENPHSHKDNAFIKHAAEYHQGEEQEVQYAMELVGHYTKPVERQVCEGVVCKILQNTTASKTLLQNTIVNLKSNAQELFRVLRQIAGIAFKCQPSDCLIFFVFNLTMHLYSFITSAVPSG